MVGKMYHNNNIKVSLSFEKAIICFAPFLIAQPVCMITLSSAYSSQLLSLLMVLICFPSSSITMLVSISLSIIWTATFFVYICRFFLIVLTSQNFPICTGIACYRPLIEISKQLSKSICIVSCSVTRYIKSMTLLLAVLKVLLVESPPRCLI